MNFILENIVSPVVGLFRDFLLKQVLLTIQVGDKVEALRHDAAVLKDRCQTVKNAVDAQERGTSKKCTAEVQGWLRRAEEILHVSQEIEADYQNRNCMLGTWCSLNCCSNYSISLRTINVHQRVNDALDFIAKVTDFVAEVAPPLVQETNTSVASTSASGQLKAMQEKALSFIHKDTHGTLGIWGMGGVGKTTLLQLINNSMMSDGFTVIFVVASSGCTEEKLRELIAENQGLSLKGDLKKIIFDFLKGKDFVLLVDDLWDRLNLVDIGVPLPLGTCNGRRRKLILTTRLLHICGEMGAGDNVIKLECLKREEAWALFQNNVGEGLLRSNPDLEDLAKEVAGECEGHPLALITVGQALAQTGDVMVWEDALKKLSMSRMHEIIDHSGHGVTTTGRNKDPILLLKVSYDFLHPPSLKDCFLHCALWPEDHRINKNDLVECWMGHGLLSNEQLDDIADVYKEGQVFIDKLLKACLLENVEESYKTAESMLDSHLKNSRVKMHDLTRDMALWVARECGANKKKWQVLTDHGKEEASEEAHKISIMYTKTKVLTTRRIRKWPNLTTLILRRTSSLRDEDVTNIQYCSLLKYLDVSGNDQIWSFPLELCKLDRLEHLDFSRTKICTLPEEAKSLVNLMVLFFRGAPIRSIPYGMLTNMSRLLVLDISVLNHPEPADQSEIIDGLDHMSSPPKALGINVSTDSGFRKLASLSGVSMTSLSVHTMENSTTIHLLSEDFLGKPHMHSDLRMLSISNCKGLGHLVLQTRCRLGTEVLYLYNLTVLKEIIWRNVQPRDALPKLRYVDIRYCKILEDVSWVAQLPCLEHLTVFKCASLRRIVGEQVVLEPLAFRGLRSLKLVALQNLRSICDQESVFPSLEHLYVLYCSKLKKLPFGSPASSPKLQKITGSERWWRSLVMEETLRTSLRPVHYELDAFKEAMLAWHTKAVRGVF